MFGALFCTLAVKFYHSARLNCVNEYFSWILADIAVLMLIELVLVLVCFRRTHKWIIRTACIIAAVVCTWSVMNAAWLIKTGTQILPTVLLPLVRDPLNALSIIGVSLVKMPAAAVILLGPSAIALTFFFVVLAKAPAPACNGPRLKYRLIFSLVVVLTAALAHTAVTWRGTLPYTSVGMRYNCQFRALKSLLYGDTSRPKTTGLASTRKVPAFDEIKIDFISQQSKVNHNLVVIVLEGMQYKYTSLAQINEQGPEALTPYLASVARTGAEFTNARCTLTHTTKVLFSLLTGRYPSVAQDIAEAVPAGKPYASLATVLKHKFGFKTAFFQSAKGSFEARPGLVHNLGFDKFRARDDLNDKDLHLGYLASDEFAMLDSIVEWIKTDKTPFFLTVLCSVTHDPYQVPDWFASPAKKPLERYRQTILYTDKFLAALDTELDKLNLTDDTIFCVVGDHGEAFGEHGLLGHERIAFEEGLRIPFCIRAPGLIEPTTKITIPVSSIDLAPTVLSLFGFDISNADLDGLNVLAPVGDGRKVYFAGWLRQSPSGFITASRKYVYSPVSGIVTTYDLVGDPAESAPSELSGSQAQQIAKKIIKWRDNSLFALDQRQTGEKMLFERWSCSWTDRICSARYLRRQTE